jgi:ABC-type lipoprotein release transport system permease subunit
MSADQLRLLFLLALRNLTAHKVKSGIIGAILFVGTLFIVVGNSMLDSVQGTMEQALTSSLVGHIQVYDKNAKDPLQIFGGMGMGRPDNGEIVDFSRIRDPLLQHPNVATVVPMATTTATVFGQTELDGQLERLRAAVAAGDSATQEAIIPQVRRLLALLLEQQEQRARITAEPEKVEADKAALARAMTDEFWQGFRASPLTALDELDTQIAPLAADGRILYFRAIGTDLDLFTKTFDRFHIVDGQMVPPGEQGFLMSKRTYELLVKGKVARDFDAIKKKWEQGQRIAEDKLLAEAVGRMSRQYASLIFQLSVTDAPVVEAELSRALPDVQGGLEEKLQAFLNVDDSNILERHRQFYEIIAPRIELYDVKVGDTIALRAFTSAGYLRSVNVKIWGTYEFDGLESADLMTATNLIDLATFRQLYGKMGAAELAELQGIRNEVGVKDISRESAEDALFGGGPAEAAPAAAASAGPADSSQLVINAAVVLKDKAQLWSTLQELSTLSEAQGLGIQAIDWQTAAGLIGQFIWVMRAVLLLCLFVIFLVAIIIINNAMVMATTDRIPEIGTMRAIGAQRSMVIQLILLETAMLGLMAGGSGALVGGGLMAWLHSTGLPAPADVFVLLFAGQRLYPSAGAGNLLFGVASVVLVALISAAWPALMASRVAPVIAMQGKE